MSMEHFIADIESCNSLIEMRDLMHRVACHYGFVGFNHMDVGTFGDPTPFYFGTSGRRWEEEYSQNGFVAVDPCLDFARRRNLPFHWGSVPLPSYKTGRKPGAIKTMEAARDYGFTEGFVCPYHFVDADGRPYSALVVFFWQGKMQRMLFQLRASGRDLYLIVIYWINRLLHLRQQMQRPAPGWRARDVPADAPRLSDRERDVLSWAGRGKTAGETADILGVSEPTIQFHIRNATAKLNAVNRTQAVAKAIFLGLISL
jgi:DNA-binding CsgD family transcriptional regulator